METLILKDKKDLHWEYDNEADILYIAMNKPIPAETIDLGNGTLARIDTKTSEIVGFTILNPKGRVLEQLQKGVVEKTERSHRRSLKPTSKPTCHQLPFSEIFEALVDL